MKKKYETSVRYDIYNNKLNEGEYYSPARRGYQYKFTDATGKTKNLTSPTLQGLRIKEKMIVNGIYAGKVKTKEKSAASLKKATLPNILTEYQQLLLLKYVKEMKRSYYPIILLHLKTGLGIKELFALTLDDIFLEQKYIKVTHQFKTEKCLEIIVVDEKKVDFDDEVKAALVDQFEIAQYIHDTVGVYEIGSYNHFLFTTSKGNSLTANCYNTFLSRVRKAYNKKIDSLMMGEEEGPSYLPHLTSTGLTNTARMVRKHE